MEMNQLANATINPYFSPSPFLTQWPAKAVTILSLILVIPYGFIVAFCSPKMMSWNFRALLIYHSILAAFHNILVGYLAYPNMVFPYVGIHFIGFLSDWNVSQLFQTELVVSSAVAAMTAVLSLFYYRLELILPPHHFLKQKWIRFLVYAVNYPVISLTNFPIMYLLLGSLDQQKAKQDLYSEYRVDYPNFFTNEVQVTIMKSTTPGFWVAVIAYPLVGLHFSFMLNYSCYKIYRILKHHNQTMSDITKNHHLSVIKSLGGLFFCFLFVLMAMFLPVLLLIYHQSWRSDLFILAAFNGMISIPIIYVTQLFSYKPYRTAIFSLIPKIKRHHDGSTVLVHRPVSISINK